MRWSLLIVVLYVWTVAEGHQLKCPNILTNTCSQYRNGRFYIDGHQIKIKHTNYNFMVKCDKAEVLDSAAMPHFLNQVNMSTVELDECPLPALSSIADMLRGRNINLQQTDKGESTLVLNNYAPTTVLTAQHFVGLDSLASLEIKPEDHSTTLDINVLSGLRNLHSLTASHVSIQDPNSPGSDLKMLVSSLASLKKLQLVSWKEKRFSAFERCENLSQLDLYSLSVEELPERWIGACPNLEKLTLKSANKLHSLPQRLFEGATALKHLTLTRLSNIESLPEGFLEGAPNLISFQMSHGKLKTLSSEVFRGTRVRVLNLSFNVLDAHALEALSSLTSLTKLDVNHNANIRDVCDQNGYSSLRNLKQLKEISFQQTSINRICRDWRDELTFLKYMDLRETQIELLTFADFHFTRDPSVEYAEVMLDDSEIISINFTEEDYNNALKAPRNTASSVRLSWSYSGIDCSCEMYWTRKTFDIANVTDALSPSRLRCDDNRYFMAQTAEDICPEKQRASA